MEIWLTCPDLTAVERSAIEPLRDAPTIESFMMVKSILAQSHWGFLVSAIHKARAAGLLRTWP